MVRDQPAPKQVNHPLHMSIFPVPITIQDDIELAVLALQIAGCRAEHDQLQRELAPLEASFAAFEHRVASQTATMVAERNRLRYICDELDRYTSRLHARLISDPKGHLSAVFTPEELRAIGDLFGISMPEDLFEPASHTTTQEQNWEYADDAADGAGADPPISSTEAEELRLLYRQLAKAFHPDLATDAGEREFRQEMMLRVNHAWQMRDLAAMQSIQQGTADFSGQGPLRLALIEVIRRRAELAHLTAVCAAARNRLHQLRTSRTRPLWSEPTLAKTAIARHVRKLETEIAELGQRHVMLVEEFRQALGTYTSQR